MHINIQLHADCKKIAFKDGSFIVISFHKEKGVSIKSYRDETQPKSLPILMTNRSVEEASNYDNFEIKTTYRLNLLSLALLYLCHH